MGLLAWIIVGVIAGFLAKMVMPGARDEPSGFLGTMLLGIVGAVVGGMAGGLAGKGIAESIDPTVEDSYWRDNYASRPYYDETAEYDVYRPAYQHGWEARTKYADRTFDEVEPDLQRDWDATHARTTKLPWTKARLASRDAWDRLTPR